MVMRSQRFSKPAIIFVTPDNFSKDIGKAIVLTKAVIDGGVSLVQIRDRKGTPDDIRTVVYALLGEGVSTHNLVINGMPPADVLSLNKGLGIHIKEKDIPMLLPAAKELMAPNAVIGCAVHTAAAAKQAADITEPDYFQVGTMFATSSHPGKIPEGPSLLDEIRNAVGSSPLLIGVGGIGPDNVNVVIDHGADGVAVLSLLASAPNPTVTAASLLNKCEIAYTAQNLA